MRNICLVVEYIGKNYCGYQKQPQKATIEQCLQTAIKQITNEEVKLYASGRTDAGVNALGQVVNFFTNSTLADNKFSVVLNRILPPDIKVISSRVVEDCFNSRFDAKRKTYIYKICTSEHMSVFDDGRVLHFPYKLDFELLDAACKILIGTHDFSSFMASKSSIKANTSRTIFDAHFERNGEYLTFAITGNGFLYNMVRIIVGTLLDIGRGKMPLNIFDELFAGNNRKLAGKTVKAYALYLKNVDYGDENGL